MSKNSASKSRFQDAKHPEITQGVMSGECVRDSCINGCLCVYIYVLWCCIPAGSRWNVVSHAPFKRMRNYPQNTRITYKHVLMNRSNL